MYILKFVVLKSKYNGKYLRYIDENVEVNGFLQFSGEEIVSPLSKLELVTAESGNGLVHLRCTYNNKFLTRWTEKHRWLVAGADHPEEDQSKWSCTLFRPMVVDSHPQALRFMHVQLGHYACLWRAAKPYTSCLYGGAPTIDRDECDVFQFYDWDAVMSNYVNGAEVGPWGGSTGQPWSFEVTGGGITKIVIQSEEVVDAIAITGQAVDGKLQQSSNFGGQGGKPSEILIDWPSDYLTSIKGVYGVSSNGSHVVKWMELTTNFGKKYGPYGNVNGDGTPFSYSMEHSAIVGFHGRSGSHVEAIGIYTRPTYRPT